ncbi:hypothetical protein [Achromobacter sp. K91]|uniref:hypothetical protein n=1 Tax=Achromobacter sp. K91 TaxID=2292262 RepID=UPI0011C490D3|nr:hypothetical protein [Achromobacter sp. K91]
MSVRRFVVVVDESTTKEKRDLITQALKKKFGFWHWIGNAWILTDRSGRDSSAAEIRDEVRKVTENAVPQVLVIQIDGETAPSWAGFGKKETFKWFHSTWVNKEDES